MREGWDKRGVRSRLDRRRTVKQAIRRRAIQTDPAPFTDDDLRFRQLVRRERPATNAAVIFALDVSGSMGETERQLAKTFFFFALQGIRRQYAKVEVAFVAHSAEAWEFNESQFFQTSGTGGTVSSTAFKLAQGSHPRALRPVAVQRVSLLRVRRREPRGRPRARDRVAARSLRRRSTTAASSRSGRRTASRRRPKWPASVRALQRENLPLGMARVTGREDVWNALRQFFQDQQARAEAA